MSELVINEFGERGTYEPIWGTWHPEYIAARTEDGEINPRASDEDQAWERHLDEERARDDAAQKLTVAERQLLVPVYYQYQPPAVPGPAPASVPVITQTPAVAPIVPAPAPGLSGLPAPVPSGLSLPNPTPSTPGNLLETVVQTVVAIFVPERPAYPVPQPTPVMLPESFRPDPRWTAAGIDEQGRPLFFVIDEGGWKIGFAINSDGIAVDFTRQPAGGAFPGTVSNGDTSGITPGGGAPLTPVTPVSTGGPAPIAPSQVPSRRPMTDPNFRKPDTWSAAGYDSQGYAQFQLVDSGGDLIRWSLDGNGDAFNLANLGQAPRGMTPTPAPASPVSLAPSRPMTRADFVPLASWTPAGVDNRGYKRFQIVDEGGNLIRWSIDGDGIAFDLENLGPAPAVYRPPGSSVLPPGTGPATGIFPPPDRGNPAPAAPGNLTTRRPMTSPSLVPLRGWTDAGRDAEGYRQFTLIDEGGDVIRWSVDGNGEAFNLVNLGKSPTRANPLPGPTVPPGTPDLPKGLIIGAVALKLLTFLH